jgi:glycosyltransferase involved in cell wall biosynthesis
MKIAVLLARYSISGVPLAQMRLARALADAGHDVDLVIGYVDPKFTLPDIPGVRRIDLGRDKVRALLLPLRKYLAAQKPDIVFSAEDHLNALVLAAAVLARSRAKISGSSRVTPFDTYSNTLFSKRWFLKHIMRLLTWRADALTCVSEDMVAQYRTVFGAPPHVCVYNIVENEQSRARMAEPLDDPFVTERTCPLVVAAGSLAPWKGFADLIRAIAVLRDRGREVRLAILGEGALRGELEALIAELTLGDRVRLLGHIDNPLAYFARAEVFALSSYVEGLPNVLVEAMMSGCTPVSTDCPTGPREVLQGGRFGYLVPVRDPEAMADGIASALDKPIAKEHLAEAVRPFAEKTVLRRHFEILGLTGESRL